MALLFYAPVASSYFPSFVLSFFLFFFLPLNVTCIYSKTDKSMNSEQLFSGWQVRCIPAECGYGSKRRRLNAASPERPDLSINEVIRAG